MRSLLNLPLTGAFELGTLNTSITEFVHNGSRWRLLRYNDASHLEGLPTETTRN
jgi:probable phosphoglycerate mutase